MSRKVPSTRFLFNIGGASSQNQRNAESFRHLYFYEFAQNIAKKGRRTDPLEKKELENIIQLSVLTA